METKKLGIENLKITLLFLIVLGNSLGKMFEDGKFSYVELALFMPLIGDIAKFFKSLSESVKEILDIDADEKNELVSFFVLKFDLKNDETELLVEKLFATIMSITLAILNIRSLFAKKEDKLEMTGLSVSIAEYQNLRVAG